MVDVLVVEHTSPSKSRELINMGGKSSKGGATKTRKHRPLSLSKKKGGEA